MVIIGIAIIVSFVWREYSVINFERKPAHLALHFLHFTITVCMPCLSIPFYVSLLAEEKSVLRFLKEV